MDLIETIDLQDCPICGGAAAMFEEGGWAITIQCCDCGAHTAVSTYENEDDRLEAAKRAAFTWNIGKVINPAPGE